MAKLSSVNKNERRKALAKKYGPVRAELRAKALDQKLSEEDRYAARMKLQKMPRDTAPSRVRNRCRLTGRPRGNLTKFGLCRLLFRQMAHRGLIPGVTKASW
ncbi:MAG: 30S ribosomal protein S14 [Bdellovibrionales bacterium]|nr:30S ribosomal protein S14 [Bdellovibrionales bacterium]